MEDVGTERLRETWDRLVLLLIATPRTGWENEYEEITRREIERLAMPASGIDTPRSEREIEHG